MYIIYLAVSEILEKIVSHIDGGKRIKSTIDNYT